MAEALATAFEKLRIDPVATECGSLKLVLWNSGYKRGKAQDRKELLGKIKQENPDVILLQTPQPFSSDKDLEYDEVKTEKARIIYPSSRKQTTTPVDLSMIGKIHVSTTGEEEFSQTESDFYLRRTCAIKLQHEDKKLVIMSFHNPPTGEQGRKKEDVLSSAKSFFRVMSAVHVHDLDEKVPVLAGGSFNCDCSELQKTAEEYGCKILDDMSARREKSLFYIVKSTSHVTISTEVCVWEDFLGDCKDVVSPQDPILCTLSLKPLVRRELAENETFVPIVQYQHLHEDPQVISLDYCEDKTVGAGKMFYISVKESSPVDIMQKFPPAIRVDLPKEVVEIPVKVVKLPIKPIEQVSNLTEDEKDALVDKYIYLLKHPNVVSITYYDHDEDETTTCTGFLHIGLKEDEPKRSDKPLPTEVTLKVSGKVLVIPVKTVVEGEIEAQAYAGGSLIKTEGLEMIGSSGVNMYYRGKDYLISAAHVLTAFDRKYIGSCVHFERTDGTYDTSCNVCVEGHTAALTLCEDEKVTDAHLLEGVKYDLAWADITKQHNRLFPRNQIRLIGRVREVRQPRENDKITIYGGYSQSTSTSTVRSVRVNLVMKFNASPTVRKKVVLRTLCSFSAGVIHLQKGDSGSAVVVNDRDGNKVIGIYIAKSDNIYYFCKLY